MILYALDNQIVQREPHYDKYTLLSYTSLIPFIVHQSSGMNLKGSYRKKIILERSQIISTLFTMFIIHTIWGVNLLSRTSMTSLKLFFIDLVSWHPVLIFLGLTRRLQKKEIRLIMWKQKIPSHQTSVVRMCGGLKMSRSYLGGKTKFRGLDTKLTLKKKCNKCHHLGSSPVPGPVPYHTLHCEIFGSSQACFGTKKLFPPLNPITNRSSVLMSSVR